VAINDGDLRFSVPWEGVAKRYGGVRRQPASALACLDRIESLLPLLPKLGSLRLPTFRSWIVPNGRGRGKAKNTVNGLETLNFLDVSEHRWIVPWRSRREPYGTYLQAFLPYRLSSSPILSPSPSLRQNDRLRELFF
jgi:hypothetical protein